MPQYNPETGLKQCNACKNTFPLTAFGRDRSTSDGYSYQCRTCRYQSSVKRTIKNDGLPRGRASDNNQKTANMHRSRRRLIEQYPNSLSDHEWAKCVVFWNGRCCYCGQTAHRLHKDHFIPLGDPECVGTVAMNIVPACGSCNISKRNHHPELWLSTRYNRPSVELILLSIYLYFGWVYQDYT